MAYWKKKNSLLIKKQTCLEGLSLVHRELNLSLGVAINIGGSCALLFENLELTSW